MIRTQRSFRTWFTSSQGREVAFYGICTAGIGVGLGNLLPHVFWLDKYQEFIQMYQLGIPAPVSQKVKSLMKSVMNDMHISEKEHKFIKEFTVFGYDVFHAGSTSTKNGAIIGIPSNFSYTTTNDVDKNNILVDLKQVNWNSDSGKHLLETMVLSDDAQKFALGREISHVRTLQVFLNSIYPAGVIAFMYGLSKNTNDKFGLLHKNISVRLVFYSLITMFCFGTWAFLKDYTTVHYEMWADKEMCKLGEHYIKGGLEFYSKLIMRNKALRELMGEKGQKLYTTTGNDQFMLRQRHLPLTLRKEYLENRLKELQVPSSPPSQAQGTSMPYPA